MTTVRIPFHESQTSGHESIAGAVPLSENILVDGAAAMYVFPGTSTWDLFPTTIPNASPVIGMRKFKEHLVYVTEDRKVFAVTAPGVVTTLSTATVTLEGGQRPTFADGGDRLLIAGGGRIAYWDGIGIDLQVITDPEAPQTTHVVATNDRIWGFVKGVSQEISFTDAGVGNQVTGWQGESTAAISRFDDILALHDDGTQVYAFGTESIQVFETVDPKTNPLGAATLPFPADDIGLGAAYSVIKIPELKLFAWLDQNKRIVLGTGRGELDTISIQIARDLAELETWDDAIGWRILFRDHDLLIWKFPKVGRTFCYDLTRKRWMELNSRPAEGGSERAVWPVQSLYRWADQGVTLAGLSTGEIQILSDTATTVAGETYIGSVETGFRNHGGESDKETIELRMRAKRGTEASPKTVQVQYRDAPGPYRTVNFSLGAPDDTAHTVKRRIADRPYTARDWKITIPPTHTVVGVEELFEILEE